MTKIYHPHQENQYAKDFNRIFTKRYSNSKKILNLGKAMLAQKKLSLKLNSMPYVVYIDPANICPLQCPLCPTGLRQHGRKTGLMSLETCKKIIDQTKEYTFFIRFYNWGEPFINQDIFQMIDYAHKNKVGTNFSTNFNPVDDEMIEKIASSPLDYLIVSIDGTNQEAYEKYRKGGDFQKVISNLEKLIALKNKNMIVEWLFVVNKHNQHQMKEAERLAQEIGVDILHFSPTIDSLSATDMSDRGGETYKEFQSDYKTDCEKSSFCSWLYSRMVFNWDGKVSPCCALDGEKYDFGDTNKNSVKEIWNNEKYQLARRVFRDGLQNKYKEFICSKCLFIK